MQPLARRREAGKGACPDLRAYLRNHVAGALGLQLLRVRSLLLHVLSLSFTKSPVDVIRTAGRYRLDTLEIDAGTVAGVAQHRVRLAATEDDDLGVLQLMPVEVIVGVTRADEKPVHLVDLREVQRVVGFTALDRIEGLARRRLHDMRTAVSNRIHRGNPGGRYRPFVIEPLAFQEPARHGDDQRRVKRRK